MLTFFRKIRKGLLGSGATRKYLVYAVGEIALVVIGILIALQINNWNQANAKIVLEIEMLKEFQIQFENDLIEGYVSEKMTKSVSTSVNDERETLSD